MPTTHNIRPYNTSNHETKQLSENRLGSNEKRVRPLADPG